MFYHLGFDLISPKSHEFDRDTLCAFFAFLDNDKHGTIPHTKITSLLRFVGQAASDEEAQATLDSLPERLSLPGNRAPQNFTQNIDVEYLYQAQLFDVPEYLELVSPEPPESPAAETIEPSESSASETIDLDEFFHSRAYSAREAIRRRGAQALQKTTQFR